jgi:hypothetical protein
MIRIEFIFSRFKSIPLGASGEIFRNQTKGEKSLFTLRGLVSCDANKTSSELPLHQTPLTPDRRHVERPPPSLQITSNFPVFYGLSHGTTLKKKGVAFFRAGPNRPSPPTHFWQKNSTIPPPSSNFVI